MKKQDLAIAYNIKRKAKKMAEGGPVSAKSEARPIPSQLSNDAMEARKSEAPKSHPALPANAKRPKLQPISQPSMVSSKGPFSVKSAKEVRDEEIRRSLEKHDAINDDVSMHSAEADMVQHPARLEEDDDQMRPAKAEIMHSHEPMLAEGGMIDDMDQPEEEEDLDHDSSIASAIMAKRRMMAEGGQIDLESNAHEDVHVEHDLNLDAAKKENYSESDMLDEDQPMDSNEHSDDIDADKHDMVSMIRRKMKTKSPMVR